MPDALTAIVFAAMLALAIAWFVFISTALSDKTKAEAFFLSGKKPKDPV